MRRRDLTAGHNERMKLLANSINAVGLAFVAFGVVRPVVDAGVDLTWDSLNYGAGALAVHALAHYIVSQVEADT